MTKKEAMQLFAFIYKIKAIVMSEYQITSLKN